MQPLPTRSQPNRSARTVITDPNSSRGNTGLMFNKFFDLWPKNSPVGDFRGPDQKQEFLKRFAGSSKDSSQAAQRVKALVQSQRGDVKCFTSTAPLVTGMGLPHPVENGFLWHHTLGVPYLSGSSVKGMLRAWCHSWAHEAETDIQRLFGDQNSAGSIACFDVFPTKSVTLSVEVITPHIGDWRITDTPQNSPPADWVTPVPIPFLAIAPGAQLQFALAPRLGADTSDPQGDLEKAWEMLGLALNWMGAGARTKAGFGIFWQDGGDFEAAGGPASSEREALELAVGATVQIKPNARKDIAGKRAIVKKLGANQYQDCELELEGRSVKMKPSMFEIIRSP